MLSRERNLRIQYSCREKRDANFSKWPIAGNPSEFANWSTMIIKQSSIQNLNTRRECLAASREEKQGYAAHYLIWLSKTGILPSVSSEHGTVMQY